MHDIKRKAIGPIKQLLKSFPCVAILGARQVGKTTLLKQILPTFPFFDLEKTSDIERIQRDPAFFLSQYDSTIVLDEAQFLPDLFPALRIKIDSNRNKNGQYLLSGSSSPELLTKISESLAGRIAIFELDGFSADESWQIGKNPIYQHIADRNIDKILSLKPLLSNTQLLESCFFGSYPEPFLRHKNDSKIFEIWMENYFQSHIKRDIRNLFPGLKIYNYQRFVAMLASASGQILNASDFARSLDVSQPTVKSYFNIAHGTFIWRMIPSYQKNISKRTIKMPKGHMRDTGLLNYLLRNHNLDSMQSHHSYGRIWESFVIEEILKGFHNNLIRVDPYFYRTSNQAEIDLILEGRFGLIPIEIKAGTGISKKNLVTLDRFVQEQNLPLGIVINQSKEIIHISKNILQIPASCL